MMPELRRSHRWLVVALSFTLAALLAWPVATVRWIDLPGITPLVAGGLIVIQLTVFCSFSSLKTGASPCYPR